ncbi:polysaccharide biosynthesis/export family protein [bacterium]|nr:polysaccharide biosynthesis/export family protein [bacterium]
MKHRFFAVVTLVFVLSIACFAQADVIVPGKTITITVLGHPELSQIVRVSQDGTTDYPLLVNVPIEGMTVNELRDILSPILQRYVEKPRLFIDVSIYTTIDVRVLGAVQSPGLKELVQPVDIQSAIVLSGGMTAAGDERNVLVVRTNSQGKRERFTVNLLEMYRLDNNILNIFELQFGDIIVVPVKIRESFVQVLGSVRKPGPIVPGLESTLLDVINVAGGVDESGHLGRVTLYKKVDDHLVGEKVDVRRLINDGLENQIPRVYPGDVVVVGSYKLYESWEFWGRFFRDLGYVLTTIVLIDRAFL